MMNNTNVLFKITSIILVVTLFFSLQTNIVLADDTTPNDPLVTEEMLAEVGEPAQETTAAPETVDSANMEASEEAPTQSLATIEPTDCIENCPDSEPSPETVVENIPTEQPTLQETALVQPPLEEMVQQTPTVEPMLETEVADMIAAAEEADVNLVLLDETQEIEPMSSNEAVEILTGGDPYFQDTGGNWIGYTNLGGTCAAIVTACNQVATPVQAAINAAPVGAIIYIEKDTYVENIVIGKSLTLTGLWSGNEDFSNRPTLQGSVTITAEYVTFENFIVNAAGNAYGIEIQGDSATINNNDILNATGANIFVNNADSATIMNNTIANSSTGDGVLVVNSNNPDIQLNTIDNNGNGSPGTVGGISFSGATNAYIYHNNITNNNYGVINSTGIINAQNNYFNGNTTDVLGSVLTTPGFPEVVLPADLGFPQAPSTSPNEDINPPSRHSFSELSYPLQNQQNESECGTQWDTIGVNLRNSKLEQFQDNIWIRYDSDLRGWVHDMGNEGSAQFLRKEDGAWYSLSEDGIPTIMPSINDNNWSILDGNWCKNSNGGQLMYEDCFLYYYENGTFQWALSTKDSTYFNYNAETASWIPRI